MRYLLLLILAAQALSLPAQAGRTSHRAEEQQHSPAQGMVQTLRSMSLLLDGVGSRTGADAAAPQLLELGRQFRTCQTAAEGQAPMSNASLNRHLAQMDLALNDFRLACARVLREQCYGSTALGKAVKKVAQEF